MKNLKAKSSLIETVFVVCTKDTQSILYVYHTWEKAQEAAKTYEDSYGTPCVVFEEELRSN